MLIGENSSPELDLGEDSITLLKSSLIMSSSSSSSSSSSPLLNSEWINEEESMAPVAAEDSGGKPELILLFPLYLEKRLNNDCIKEMIF